MFYVTLDVESSPICNISTQESTKESNCENTVLIVLLPILFLAFAISLAANGLQLILRKKTRLLLSLYTMQNVYVIANEVY